MEKSHINFYSVIQAVLVTVATAILTSYTTVKVVESQLENLMRRVELLEGRVNLQSDRVSRMEGSQEVIKHELLKPRK